MTRWPQLSPSHIAELRDASRSVLAELVPIDHPHQVHAHRHSRGQFVYAGHGVLEVEVLNARHVVPARVAAWIPPGVPHAVTAPEAVEYCSLFVDATASRALPDSARLVGLTPLVRELTRAAASMDQTRTGGAEARLRAVILDQLSTLAPARYALPIPRSPRLRHMARRLLDDCRDPRDLGFWAAESCMSTRTLVRQFKRETGLSFGQWLRRVRVVKAMKLLDSGCSVTSAAWEVGYQQVSAFIAMFRRDTGLTPSEYQRGGD